MLLLLWCCIAAAVAVVVVVVVFNRCKKKHLGFWAGYGRFWGTIWVDSLIINRCWCRWMAFRVCVFGRFGVDLASNLVQFVNHKSIQNGVCDLTET